MIEAQPYHANITRYYYSYSIYAIRDVIQLPYHIMVGLVVIFSVYSPQLEPRLLTEDVI